MTTAPFRLPTGGRVDRSLRVNFLFNGRPLRGFHGDTLASALLANGFTLIGRSFKYHRPRGVLSAGIEEPNGLFTLGEGGRSEPNIAGTTTELIEGLVAHCQNGWPSVRWDLMSIVSLLAPLLAAGFYYKTFMGPTLRAWMFYERFIRRAAGLGRARKERDPDRYSARHAFVDVLVVGAGPAGLAAALAAAQGGARVMLAEQDSLVGGSLLRESATGPAEAWRRQMELQLEQMPNVEILCRTTVVGLYDGNSAALIRRHDHVKRDPAREARQNVITVRAGAIVLATGAIERPLVFSNNDRPGVMLASAVRSYLNRFAVVCGRRAVVVTNNDTAYAAAFDLARHGVAVTVADLRGAVHASLAKEAEAQGIDLITGATIVRVLGRRAVKGIMITAPPDTRTRKIQCDLVCMSGGWSPTVHLASHGGIKPRYQEDIAAFVPGGYPAGQFGAGALTGCCKLDTAISQAVEAGLSAASWMGRAHSASTPVLPPLSATSAVAIDGYSMKAAWPIASAAGSWAFVDFQNDVTVKDLTLAHQEGYLSVEHLKRYTTLGMGTDQGKTSNINALAMMANLRGVDIPTAGTTTFRPPYTPVAIGALAAGNIGQHFRPIRRSPLHAWHLAHGAQMIEAGLWLRPWFYRWAGATAESAYLQEMRLVRNAVGLSDVSTLGKIDVQGPDAAEFLNRVYVNEFAKLAVGKARYGVMLNDDGTVLDDGTATRLSQTHYFMTTTTAQAGEVMSWLEFLLQTAWTDLKVHVTSVTDEWAAMAVAGPKARAALELAFPQQDFSDRRLPFMGAMQFELNGVTLRFIRVSFSGELAYEIYVPADYGVGLWEHLLERATSLGIQPYGLEALASLRIEKGHVAGLELDHRNTLNDLGLGKLASGHKAFVGRELGRRPSLLAAARWSLVGIESLEPGRPLRGGSILFAAGDKIEGHGRGYITSVTWSTTQERFIALGLYQGGLAHAGEEIVCAYPLKDEQVRARLVKPMFFDPAGERLRV